MTMDIKSLSSRLGSAIEEPSLSSEWAKLMKIFSLSSDDLLYKWESFVIRDDLKISIDNLQLFQEHLQKDLEEKSKKLNIPSSVSRATPKLNGSSPDFLGSMLKTPGTGAANGTRKRALQLQTPSRVKHARNEMPSSPIGSQLSSPLRNTPTRTNVQTISQPILTSSQIIETLNNDIPSATSTSSNPPSLLLNVNLKRFNYRTMYQKLGDASEFLDLQIEEAVDWVKKAYNFDDEVFGNPALQSQQEIITVGRIVSDSLTTDKLNKESMMIESSRRLCSGMRARINLKEVFQDSSKCSFFPGQIVALKGVNANGVHFVVKKIIDLPLLPNAATNKSEIRDYYENTENKPLNILVACGPYTDDNSFEFKQLHNFVNYVNNLSFKPSAIVLNGPFIDFNHTLVRSGNFKIPESYGKDSDSFTPDDIFRAFIKPILLLIDSSIHVVLIPSINDINSNHAAFPQRPFDRKSLELPKNFKCLSNPATFQINEIVINTSSIESIHHILSNLVSNGNNDIDMNSLAIEHILRQRRVYPVFPSVLATSRAIPTDTSLDVPYLGLGSINGANPDIMITPSRAVKYSAKIVNNVVTINPQSLGIRGTFASITINPLNIEGEEEELTLHKAWERTRVDIIKLQL